MPALIARSDLPVIVFEDISLEYNGKAVIKGLSFAVAPGDKVLVAGRSGLGKSSLFKLLLGFVQPSAGRIQVNNQPLAAQNIWALRQQIAWVDQNARLGSGTVRQQLEAMGRLAANRHLGLDAAKLVNGLEALGLRAAVLDQPVASLSGGERQRVALAFARLLQRPVLLLDEVTSALDSTLKSKVAHLFSQEPATTCLVISHDVVWQQQPGMRVFNLETGTWLPGNESATNLPGPENV